MALNKKQLINISEEQKSWIESVVQEAKEIGLKETNQTDVIRSVFDKTMAQDPESFAGQMVKMRKRARLDDVARRKQAIIQEEAQLIKEMEEESKTASRSN